MDFLFLFGIQYSGFNIQFSLLQFTSIHFQLSKNIFQIYLWIYLLHIPSKMYINFFTNSHALKNKHLGLKPKRFKSYLENNFLLLLYHLSREREQVDLWRGEIGQGRQRTKGRKEERKKEKMPNQIKQSEIVHLPPCNH